MAVDDKQLLEYLKKVTIELHDARTRLSEVERAAHDPIAIVGIGCRYPGEVRSAEQLWDLVLEGRDVISKFPDDRDWDMERIYDPDPETPGTTYTDEGGFLHDANEFDASFFGIGPREALMMDPQQRQLLEVAWEAVEHAGIDPLSLRDSNTGVFTGIASLDHPMRIVDTSLSDDMAVYLTMGNDLSVLSGRVAYVMGLGGPTMTIETACSSSLVALHQACSALRAGECSMALAGGVTVMSTPIIFIFLSRQGGVAPDGRCKSFASAADGTSFSEGAGMLLLERLSDAHRHGHDVLAVIGGSAVNQDGTSNGLTAPNGRAQERVIRDALSAARLSGEQVDAVEAHGTGTTLGDPIEAEALLATYGQDRADGRPLHLGSVKSNMGHTMAAAGVAGVIKMTMALRHEMLPKTLHVDAPSENVDWTVGDVSLLTSAVAWPRGEQPRRAGVSSFGMSGTNAHMIVEEAPPVPEATSNASDPQETEHRLGLIDAAAVPWLVSAKDADALRGQSARLHQWLHDRAELEPFDVGFSLAKTRSAFERRAVVVGGDREQLLDGLRGLAQGEPTSTLVEGTVDGDGGRVVFVFPGHGSQWPAMASQLLEHSAVFASHIEECESALAPHLDWSLMDVLREAPHAPSLERLDVAQPVLFAVMVSLAGLWRACGVIPDAVVGHSHGEIAAAHVAGALSLQDAARIAALRSRALMDITGKGGMASIGLGAGEITARLNGWAETIFLAGINGPSSTVVAGEPKALRELLSELTAEGVRVREVAGVFCASHCPQVEPLREQLLEACSGISPQPSDTAFYSTVTEKRLDTAELGPDYWYHNTREAVRFEGAMRRLLDDGFRTYIEVSPHPVLSGSIIETIDERGAQPGESRVLGTLRRGEGGKRRFLTSVGEAWSHGVEVDWGALFTDSGAAKVALPTYAFQRKRYWFTPAKNEGHENGKASAVADGLGLLSSANGAAESSLLRKLADAPAAEHREIVSWAVREQVAAVLGDISADSIDPDKSLLEIGFDSAAAVELRGRLNGMSGLRIPTRVIFDRPTPQALAAHIDARLTEMSPDSRIGSGVTAVEQVEPQLHQDGATDTLVPMLREARERGIADRFLATLMEASKFRPAFDLTSASEGDVAPEWVTFSEGSAHADLICLPTVLALSGPHQYVRFAKALDGDRTVSALALPGFVEGERLPATLDAAIEALCLAVTRRCGDTPFVLLGYSSGGWLANEVASRLEHEWGTTAAALVLLDAYPLAKSIRGALLDDALTKDAHGFVNDARLLAMGAYLRLLADWRAVEIAAPTLLVKAGEPLSTVLAEIAPAPPWELAGSEIEVRGNHLTMMEEHVDATAQAVQEWLSGTFK